MYRQTLGNKPLIFGGGSPDTSNSEDLTGVVFVNGTRPGNQAVVDIAKSQVGNVGGQPYWSWYASIPVWNGAPASCPGATARWGCPSRALPPASPRVFRGSSLTDNGAGVITPISPPATPSSLTGTWMAAPTMWALWSAQTAAGSTPWRAILATLQDQELFPVLRVHQGLRPDELVRPIYEKRSD